MQRHDFTKNPEQARRGAIGCWIMIAVYATLTVVVWLVFRTFLAVVIAYGALALVWAVVMLVWSIAYGAFAFAREKPRGED